MILSEDYRMNITVKSVECGRSETETEVMMSERGFFLAKIEDFKVFSIFREGH